MSNRIEIKWQSKPAEHDYPAAAEYLQLIYPRKKVTQLVKRMRAAPVVEFKAADLFRASALEVFGVSSPAVEAERKKLRGGIKASPILLVRDERNAKLIIADGYHRLCAVFSLDEDVPVACKIV